MKKLMRIIKQIFCVHTYGDAVLNPFMDQYGNHSAIYTCEKCGYRKFVIFNKNY